MKKVIKYLLFLLLGPFVVLILGFVVFGMVFGVMLGSILVFGYMAGMLIFILGIMGGLFHRWYKYENIDQYWPRVQARVIERKTLFTLFDMPCCHLRLSFNGQEYWLKYFFDNGYYRCEKGDFMTLNYDPQNPKKYVLAKKQN